MKAEDLKLRADELFKELKFEKSAKFYEKALPLEGCDPIVLNSNISACYFELGNYEKSLKHAETVKDLVDKSAKVTPNSDKLEKILEKNISRIDKIKKFLPENINGTNPALEKLNWEEKLNTIPKYRPQPTEAILYSPITHYYATSILAGKCEEDPESYNQIKEFKQSRLNLNELEPEGSNLRFFFANITDARGVFNSIIDFCDNFQSLPIQKQNIIKTQFVLNDTKPQIFGRLLILLTLLNKLSKYELDQIGKDVEATKIASMLMFIYASNVLPSYFDTELKSIIKGLIESDSYWEFMQIDDKSIKSIKQALSEWQSESPLSTEKMMQYWCLNVYNKKMDPENDYQMKLRFDELKEGYLKSLRRLPDSHELFVKNKLGLTGRNLKERVLKEYNRLPFADLAKIRKINENDRVTTNTYGEIKFMEENKYLMPPILIQNQEEKALWTDYLSVEYDSWPEFTLESLKKNDKLDAITKKLNNYVEKNWMPNVTMLDYEWQKIAGEISTNLLWDTSELIDVAYKTMRHKEPSNPKCLFDCYAAYFHSLAKSLSFLTNETKTLKLECRVGDVNDALSSLRIEAKRKELEKQNSFDFFKFDRISLGTTPDITSLTYAFLESTPLLKPTNKSSISCSCLVNTSIWKSFDQYVYSGSLIQNIEQARVLLNITKSSGGLLGYDMPVWTQYVTSFKPQMDVRSDLLAWLSRVLLAYGLPFKRDCISLQRENCAPNLSVFFRAILYLIAIGYPKHWFQIYLTTILKNELITTASYPKTSPNKYEAEDVLNKTLKKVDLSLNLIELKTLASLYAPVLEIGELFDLKPIDSIFEYELKLDSFNEGTYGIIMTCTNALSNVLGLLLEEDVAQEPSLIIHPTFGPGHDWRMSKLRDEVMGKGSIGKKHLISVFNFHADAKTARFWMSKADFEQIKDKFYVALIRTDSWDRLSGQIELSKAIEIKSFA